MNQRARRSKTTEAAVSRRVRNMPTLASQLAEVQTLRRLVHIAEQRQAPDGTIESQALLRYVVELRQR